MNGYDTNSKAYVGTSVTGTIDTVEKLINASANYSFKVDAAGTSGGVTVVYIKSATQRELSHGVTFTVLDAAGNAASGDYYTVLGRATGANSGAAVNDTVYFTLTDAAKGATVTAKVGTAAATTLTAAPIYVNGVSYANGYKVTITDNTVITITLAAPDAKAAKATAVSYADGKVNFNLEAQTVATKLTVKLYHDDGATPFMSTVADIAANANSYNWEVGTLTAGQWKVVVTDLTGAVTFERAFTV